MLLSIGYDVAFDQLLITFDPNGDLVFAPDLTPTEAKAIGIEADGRLRQIHPRHLHYLEEHRVRFQKRGQRIFSGTDGGSKLKAN